MLKEPAPIKSQTQIKQLPLLPMPDVGQQKRGEALFAQMDALKRLQAETAAELDALLPAILDKAFKGEL